MADGEVVGPGGADEAEDAVAPGDLDDEAEVEAGPAFQRLDAAEEGRVVGDRLSGAVEHGGLDLHLLGSSSRAGARGAEAHPLLPRAVLHGERLEATRQLHEEEEAVSGVCRGRGASIVRGEGGGRELLPYRVGRATLREVCDLGTEEAEKAVI